MLVELVEKIKEESKLEGKLEDVKKMLADGLPIDTIVRYTGLSRKEIEKLK